MCEGGRLLRLAEDQSGSRLHVCAGLRTLRLALHQGGRGRARDSRASPCGAPAARRGAARSASTAAPPQQAEEPKPKPQPVAQIDPPIRCLPQDLYDLLTEAYGK